jgi:small multidrug resistance family-3 protein
MRISGYWRYFDIFSKVTYQVFVMAIIRSFALFLLAGLFEIGGGYLVWLWLKEGKPLWFGITGGVILALYGIVATWQMANFGRVYAAYGGIFIVMALLWAWKVDGFKPDRYDIIGALIALIGACVIVYAPRGH